MNIAKESARVIGAGIQGLADWVGLGSTVKRMISAGETESAALKAISAAKLKARTLANNEIDELQSKLDGLSAIFPSSPAIRNAVYDAKRNIKQQLQLAQAKRDAVESKIQEADNLASDIGQQTIGDVWAGDTRKAHRNMTEVMDDALNLAKLDSRDTKNHSLIQSKITGVDKNV